MNPAVAAEPPSVIPTVEEFRSRAHAWLDANARLSRGSDEPVWGEGDDTVAVFHDTSAEAERARLAAAIGWQHSRIDGGFAGLSLPRKFGGQGLPPMFEQVYVDEELRYDIPPMPEVLGVTVRLAAPTIALWGSEEQCNQHIAALLRADEVCCQLFSEPTAGSDLAAARCRARRDGPGWVIDGQKVWTSGAQMADVGLAICRTDPDAPKHAGLTAFLIPMHLRGVEVRPIRQMTGGAAFNEVFLDGVMVPDDARLGDLGCGWKVAMSMLGFERMVAGTSMQGIGGSFARVAALAVRMDRTGDPIIRQSLARLWGDTKLQQLTMDRLRADRSAKGLEGSIGKLLWTKGLTSIGAVAAELLGPRLTADTGEWGTFCWTEHVLGAPGYRIAGGSDEIQRNILGERLLGLPPEPRS